MGTKSSQHEPSSGESSQALAIYRAQSSHEDLLRGEEPPPQGDTSGADRSPEGRSPSDPSHDESAIEILRAALSASLLDQPTAHALYEEFVSARVVGGARQGFSEFLLSRVSLDPRAVRALTAQVSTRHGRGTLSALQGAFDGENTDCFELVLPLPLGVGSGVVSAGPSPEDSPWSITLPSAVGIVPGTELPQLSDDKKPVLGQILGSYRLTGLRGQGGMGVVYEAEHVRSKARYAVKTVLAHTSGTSTNRTHRFEREILALRRLQHPNIVRIHAYGREGPYFWFAMDLIEGEELSQLIKRRELSRRKLLDIFMQVCDAVAHAHERGVIHRDLKPANVLVDDQQHAYVLDFGLAKLTDSSVLAITRTHAAIGTPFYMSPEHLTSPKLVDERSDVFALGVILYELMLGQRPFMGKSPVEITQRILCEAPASPLSLDPDLQVGFDRVLGRALEKNPEKRYSDVASFRRDVACLREGLSTGQQLTWQQKLELFLAEQTPLTLIAIGAGLAAVLFVPLLLLALSLSL